MKFKRVIAILLCVAMTLSLVACGTTGGKKPDNSNKASYTVTFDVGEEARAAGIQNPDSVTVKAGEKITLPSPVWADHQIVHWMNGTAVFTSSTSVNSDITLVAEWITITQYDRDINDGKKDWVQSGHLYIHYKRGNHVATEEGTENKKAKAPDYSGDNASNDNYLIESTSYKDWGVWVWPKNGEGKLFNGRHIDESGVVYDILLNNDYQNGGWDGTNKKSLTMVINYKDSTEIGFQICETPTRTQGSGFWVNDGGNVYIQLDDCKRDNGSYHWYVSENEVNKGTAYYTAEDVPNPYADDTTKNKYVSKGGINSNGNLAYAKWTKGAAGWEDDAVGYQIFIASFCDSNDDGIGDIPGIISQLDYLDKLNVDVLWLTPFQNSTGYHGYDISDYYSVDSKFGTLADYRKLVYEAHKRGMKVVMDFVLNHTSTSNVWFQKSSNLVKETDPKTGKTIDYRNFYNWISEADFKNSSKVPAHAKSKDDGGTGDDSQWFRDKNGYYYYSSFSSTQPELNFDYQPVRDAIIDVALYWMGFGLDGFRLDAVKHIYMANEVRGYGKTIGKLVEDSNAPQYGVDEKRNLHFYNEFNARLKAVYPNAYVVGENLTGDPAQLAPYYAGIDSQFNFNLYYDTSRAVAQSTLQIQQGGQNVNMSYFSTAANARTKCDNLFRQQNSNYIDGQFTSNHDLPRARDRMNITGSSAKLDDTYGTFYTDNTTYELKSGGKVTCKSVAGKNLDTDAVNKTDVLLRMYYAFQLTFPGISWIYYGDELGMSGLMQYTVAANSTSSTASQPHEDVIYRQPMKWFDNDSTKGKNASFEIGYNGMVCELQGLNAEASFKGVEGQTGDDNSLLEWTRKLTKIRRDYKLGYKATMSAATNNNGILSYTVKGGNNKTITVTVYAGASSIPNPSGALARCEGTIKGSNGKYGVVITG